MCGKLLTLRSDFSAKKYFCKSIDISSPSPASAACRSLPGDHRGCGRPECFGGVSESPECPGITYGQHILKYSKCIFGFFENFGLDFSKNIYISRYQSISTRPVSSTSPEAPKTIMCTDLAKNMKFSKLINSSFRKAFFATNLSLFQFSLESNQN